MEYRYDQNVKNGSIRLNNKAVDPSKSQQLGYVQLSFAEDGTPVLIEFINMPKYVDDPNVMSVLLQPPAMGWMTVEEMADYHDVAPNTLHRQLRADKIEGAVKLPTSNNQTVQWLIPRDIAEAWQPDPRGRKKKVTE